MVIETAVEWYRFTCMRCATGWRTRYTVRHVINAAGVARSFYRHGGVPCEQPVAAEPVCPTCHRSGLRVELVSHTVIDTVPRIDQAPPQRDRVSGDGTRTTVPPSAPERSAHPSRRG